MYWMLPQKWHSCLDLCEFCAYHYRYIKENAIDNKLKELLDQYEGCQTYNIPIYYVIRNVVRRKLTGFEVIVDNWPKWSCIILRPVSNEASYKSMLIKNFGSYETRLHDFLNYWRWVGVIMNLSRISFSTCPFFHITHFLDAVVRLFKGQVFLIRGFTSFRYNAVGRIML
ncbi:hypothetical protein KUTeg_005507 [Tegillarca granosa]|uniref:Uncharacterized protein n=1 Tax=Tegillarca granosa TaxID=220873 RepID=A0ABQ9FJW1_TEGGR|nr:hypothetical protein KUTeg_005507 [Tegillarca granosa]